MHSQHRFDEFAAAIRTLAQLINAGSKSEAAYQEWFESHPIVWQALGYTRALAHPVLVGKSGKRLIPDFIAEKPNGLADIVDLKAPGTTILVNAGTPRERNSAAVAMAQAQLREYAEFFDTDEHRQQILDELGYRVPHEPDVVLIGGVEDVLAESLHKITSQYSARMCIYTYTDILRALHVRFGQDYPIPEGLRYFGFGCVLTLGKRASNYESAFIFDLGISRSHDRIALQIDALSRLVLTAIDRDGQKLKTRAGAPLNPGRWYDIWFEVSCSSAGVACCIRVDGQTAGYLESSEGFDIRFSPIHQGRFTMGADLDGRRGATFMLHSFGHCKAPPAIGDLTRLGNFIEERVKNGEFSGSRVEFAEDQFLESGDLTDDMPTGL